MTPVTPLSTHSGSPLHEPGNPIAPADRGTPFPVSFTGGFRTPADRPTCMLQASRAGRRPETRHTNRHERMQDGRSYSITTSARASSGLRPHPSRIPADDARVSADGNRPDYPRFCHLQFPSDHDRRPLTEEPPHRASRVRADHGRPWTGRAAAASDRISAGARSARYPEIPHCPESRPYRSLSLGSSP